MTPTTADLRRRRRRGRLLRACIALAACALPVFGWRQLGDRIPPVGKQVLTAAHRLHWVAPGIGPVYLIGDARTEDVLLLGDSRAGAGIITSRFARGGIGRASVLWAAGSGVDQMLRGAADLPCERVVVCLSPLSLAPINNRAMAAILRSRTLPYDLTATVGEVLRWRDAFADQMRAEGSWKPLHDLALNRLLMDHRVARRGSRQWTHVFDYVTRGYLEHLRLSALHPIHPSRWHTSWVRPMNPRASDERYVAFLDERSVERRISTATMALERIRLLLAQGRRVAIVRLPIDAGLRRVEDEMVPPSELEGIAEAAGVPYLDLMLADPEHPWTAGDGSHLAVRDGVRATGMIAAWLRDDLGW